MNTIIIQINQIEYLNISATLMNAGSSQYLMAICLMMHIYSNHDHDMQMRSLKNKYAN